MTEALVQRYKEIPGSDPEGKADGDIPYDLAGDIIEIDTGRIDADYMNSRFEKYLKVLRSGEASEVRSINPRQKHILKARKALS